MSRKSDTVATMYMYRDFQYKFIKCLAPLCLGWSVEFSNLWEIYELHPDVFCPIKRSSVTSMRITWRSIRPNVKKRSLDSTKLCLVFSNNRSNICFFVVLLLICRQHDVWWNEKSHIYLLENLKKCFGILTLIKNVNDQE